jgi:aryl-alcohol dehydrogenase-like predicted oxidoreductase
VTVGTKAGLRSTDRSDLPGAFKRSLQESLRRLGRDSVDLLQLHSQVYVDGADAGRGLNLSDVLGGVAEGMKQVVKEGFARHVGFTATGDAAATHAIIGVGVVESMQSYFNALNPSAGFAGVSSGAQDFDGIIDDAAQHGTGVLAIRVLAAGAVTGSTERAENAGNPGAALIRGGEFERDIDRAAALSPIIKDLDLESPQELAFRFVLAKQGVSSALLGFSDIEQLEDAIRWAERGPLPEDGVKRVLAAAQ